MNSELAKLRPFFDRFKLRYWREMRVLTQSELAGLMGKAPSYGKWIGGWERGRTTPNMKSIRTIAEALDIRPEELMSTESDLLAKEKELAEVERGIGIAQADAQVRHGIAQMRKDGRARINKLKNEAQKARYIAKRDRLAQLAERHRRRNAKESANG